MSLIDTITNLDEKQEIRDVIRESLREYKSAGIKFEIKTPVPLFIRNQVSKITNQSKIPVIAFEFLEKLVADNIATKEYSDDGSFTYKINEDITFDYIYQYFK